MIDHLPLRNDEYARDILTCHMFRRKFSSIESEKTDREKPSNKTLKILIEFQVLKALLFGG